MRARRPERGQATVELALGLVVFVTVLMVGIHFGELTHLALKVHEAAAGAAWDATAYRVERPGAAVVDSSAWYDVGRFAAPLAGARADQRYKDWDGRTSRPGRSGPTQLFTSARPMTVTCAAERGTPLEFRIQDTAVTPAYEEPGVVRCNAQGTVDVVNLPSSYEQRAEGGFFDTAQYRTLPITLCAFGRAEGGTCSGGVPLLLGDHGLTSGNGENEECARHSSDDGAAAAVCANPTFYRLAHENWDRSRPWSPLPDAFARRVTGRRPSGKVTGFYMSYRGERSGFSEIDTRSWQTTPMDHAPGSTYRDAYTERYATAVGTGIPFLYAGRYPCD